MRTVINDESLQVFLLLFERLYGVNFRAADRAAIIAAIQDAVDQVEPSGRQLFDYVLQVAGELGSLDGSKTELAKQEGRGIFNRAFSCDEPNERGRILSTVHHALEQARLGVTGVQAMRPVSPFRHMVAPPPAPPPPPPPEDPAAKVRRAQHEAEQELLKSNLEKARHEVNMSIIKNIG